MNIVVAVRPSGQDVPRFPVDGHAHFHEIGRVASILDSAARNFGRIGKPASPFLGALLLAQSSREVVFEQFTEGSRFGGWRLGAAPGESESMIACSGERRILIVCGRQVRCELGLEVLALGTTASYPDGCGLDETLDRLANDGAIAVVPWGVGKWIGRRAGRMRELFRNRDPGLLFAGDNGGRLRLLGMPRLLKAAGRAGFRVLPGTDPFPVGNDYRRAGSFGFLAGVAPDPSHPWASLRAWLGDCAGSPVPYGLPLDPLHFAINQCWIQIHNRMRRTATV